LPSFFKPDRAAIDRFLSLQRKEALSYAPQGGTIGMNANQSPPPGFRLDGARAKLGAGSDCFERAKAAVRAWRMFPPENTQLCWPEAPIEQGVDVAILIRSIGLWFLNACRIVSVVDESEGKMRRFGFAYGTLPRHLAAGEERFLVEWDQTSDEVHYDLLVYSRPRHWIAYGGYPYALWRQAQFRRQSGIAMQRACALPSE